MIQLQYEVSDLGIGGEFLLSDKKLSLFIVDDDFDLCCAFKNHFESYSQFDVMNPVRLGDEAIEIIEQHKPDIIVLDLMLPVYDGMYIMDYIINNMEGYHPIVYVLSIMGSAKTAQMLNSCTLVKYYSIKPIRPQAVANNLLRLIKDSKSVEFVENQNVNIARDVKIPANVSHFVPDGLENLEWLIEGYLKELGLQLSLISTKCTRLAIDIGIRTDKNDRIGMMEIYTQVGQVFTPPISAVAVDRNIRSVTARAIKNSTPVFEKYFRKNHSSGEYQLTNSLFLWESVDILKRWIAENLDDTAFS